LGSGLTFLRFRIVNLPDRSKLPHGEGENEKNTEGTRIQSSSGSRQPQSFTSIELKIKAEQDCVNADISCDLWFAVEVVGQAQLLLHNSHSRPLRFVVIIDNTLAVSEDSLDVACQAAFRLCRLLDNEDDKLAISSISVSGPDWEVRNELITFSPSYPEDVQRQLRSVFQDRAQAPAWGKTLEMTSRLFDGETERDRFDSDSYRNHVFILAPNLLDCKDLTHFKFPATTHYINTSVIPASLRHDFITGWYLSSSDLESKNLWDQIILSARHGLKLDCVEHANISLVPAPGCQVLRVYGELDITNIRPGQVSTVLVLMQVLTRSEEPAMVVHPNPQSKIEELFEGLEAMLGDVYQEVLAVTLTYGDLHERNNRSYQVCSLRRPDPTSLWSLADAPDSLRWPADVGFVIGRLALAISMSTTPRAAIVMLDSILTSLGSYPVQLLAQVHAVKRELLYRTRLPQGLPADSAIGVVEEITATQQLGEENLHPSTTFPVQSTRDSPDSTLTVIHNRQTSTDSTDSARKIWLHMRKDSQTKEQQTTAINNNALMFHSGQDQLVALRREAVRNKRSIGADTLRSFSLPAVDRRASVAPWL